MGGEIEIERGRVGEIDRGTDRKTQTEREGHSKSESV